MTLRYHLNRLGVSVERMPAVVKRYDRWRMRSRQKAAIEWKGSMQSEVLPDGQLLGLDLTRLHDFLMWEQIGRYGAYEPATTHRLLGALKPGDTFVDVGANNGYFSLLAARAVGPLGRVVAVEPAPSALTRLRRNVVGYPNVEVVACAASDHEGEARFRTDPDADSWGRVAADGDLVVPTKTLDALVSSADIVKIDTEEHEVEVLSGMTRLLSKGTKLIVEYTPGSSVSRKVFDTLSASRTITTLVGRSEPKVALTPPSYGCNLWCT
jgi:FkbM family methyltransferase